MDLLLRQVAKLEALAKERLALLDFTDEVQQRAARLLDMGVCPCSVMGRASTCCEANAPEESPLR